MRAFTRGRIVIKYLLFGAAFGACPIFVAAAVSNANGHSVDDWPWPWPFVIGIGAGWVWAILFLRERIIKSNARLGSVRE